MSDIVGRLSLRWNPGNTRWQGAGAGHGVRGRVFLGIGLIMLCQTFATRPAVACGPPVIWTNVTNPTIGDIIVQYLSIPLPERQDKVIGIGESVRCSWNRATWDDWDHNVPGNYDAQDTTLGGVQWYVTGDARFDNSDPTEDGVTIVAKKPAGGGSATVRLEVADNDDMYPDHEMAVETAVFAILAPTQVHYGHIYDYPDPGISWPRSLPPPYPQGGDPYGRFFGAMSAYLVFFPPFSVDFSNVQIRENFGPQGFSGWYPNQNPKWRRSGPGWSTGWFYPGGTVGPKSIFTGIGVGTTTVVNRMTGYDWQTQGSQREDALDTLNSDPDTWAFDDTAYYTDWPEEPSGCLFSLSIEYLTDTLDQNGNPVWSQIDTPGVYRQVAGTSVAARVKIGDGDWGSWQGPWLHP